MSATASPTIWLRLELLTEVVFSRRNARVGIHECLDYIPGSALLGAAAARLYQQPGFGPDFFLSGRVRFGDGSPDNGKAGPAWPVPLNYHAPKGDKTESGDLVNLLTSPPPKDKQLVQVRDRHLMADGRRATLSKRYQLKTAMDRKEHGRAMDETLHGYDALPAGAVFFAPIAFAADVPETERTTLLAVLTGGSIRLGRSRSAQYGGVKVSTVSPACAWPALGLGLPDVVVLHLASDLALFQPNGAPTLIPEPAHFGLPADARYLPSRSFVRTRRYAPWNAFRTAHDAERQVLLRGSVLAFQAPAGLDRAALAARLEEHGAGLHTSEGLGRVFVDPNFVLTTPAAPIPPQPTVRAPSPPTNDILPATPTVPENLRDAALAQCLRNRVEARRLDADARLIALTWIDSCWAYHRRDHSPSRSQWNDVRNLTMLSGDWLEKLENYFNPADSAKRAEIWNTPPPSKEGHQNLPALGTALLEECRFFNDPELARAVLCETAVGVVRRMQKKEHV